MLCLIGVIFIGFLLNPRPNNFTDFDKNWSQELAKSNFSINEINLTSLISTRASKELVAAENTLPSFLMYDDAEIHRLQKFILTCQKNRNFTYSGPLKKAWQWANYLCEKKTPPAIFFAKPPFVHPSGKSYAGLATKQFEISFEQTSHLLTVLEYLEIKYNVHLLPIQLNYLLEFNDIVMTEDLVFVAQNNERQEIVYHLYNLENWQTFIKKQSYHFVSAPHLAVNCIKKLNSGCWIEKESLSERKNTFLIYSIIFLVFISLLTISVITLRNRHLRLKELDQKKFTLQMLTHELRTPTTSLSLLAEALRSDFDQLPESQKIYFIKMTQEINRLQQMSQKSYQYLQTDNLSAGFNINKSLKSMNEYTDTLTEKYPADFIIERPAEKIFMSLDWFWLDLCLQNLIRNAFQHGKKPVTFKIEFNQNKDLVLFVIDQGHLAITEDELFNEFKKSASSTGLGLGLSMTKQILKNLNIEIEFLRIPNTQFKLTLPKKIYEIIIN